MPKKSNKQLLLNYLIKIKMANSSAKTKTKDNTQGNASKNNDNE